MIIDKQPYFMENPDWYWFDEDEFRYVLTEKATEKAKKSYDEYYAILNSTGLREP